MTSPLKILIFGVNGLIGQALAQMLKQAGHEVHGTARQPNANSNTIHDIAWDFSIAHSQSDWQACVSGFDVVINTVGGFADPLTMQQTQEIAPKALFDACFNQGIQRIIHLSAHGKAGVSDFIDTKYRADAHLLNLQRTTPNTRTQSLIIRPDLVFSPKGASTQQLLTLAQLPILGSHPDYNPIVAPIHLNDLCAQIVALIQSPQAWSTLVPSGILIASGQHSYRLDDLIQHYRAILGIAPPAKSIRIPKLFITTTVNMLAWYQRVHQQFTHAHVAPPLLNRDSLALLKHHPNPHATPLPSALEALLSSSPATPPQHWLNTTDTLNIRHQFNQNVIRRGTQIGCRLSLALVWLITA